MAQGSGFAGKRCLLTGAASGIGRATALKLAADGAELFLTDRNAEGLAETVADARALGATVSAHRALDIADYEQVAAFAADVHAAHPSMDVVMNIAGVSAWGTVSHLTHRHWESMVSINLMGPIHVIETFVPPMVAAGNGGHLVNVSSAAGLVALPWHAAYSASKYGLRGLSEVLRFDLARHGIGVSVVVPGAVKTPLVPGTDGRDRGRGPRTPAGAQVGGPVQRPRRLAGTGGRQDPSWRDPQPLPRLHLHRHPRALRVQAARVVALQRRDATGERHLHPRAATDQERVIARAHLLPQSHGGAVSVVCPVMRVSPHSL
jgi:NAD(P)-dependent dehydrogenase (short-subunit alcohol dehydrogenase family)